MKKHSGILMLMPNVIVVVLWYYYAAVPAIKLSGRSEVGRSEGGLRFNLNFEMLELQSQDLIQAKYSGTQLLTSFISIYPSKLNVFILETS